MKIISVTLISMLILPGCASGAALMENFDVKTRGCHTGNVRCNGQQMTKILNSGSHNPP